MASPFLLKVRKERGSLQQVFVACTEEQKKKLSERAESSRTTQYVQTMQHIIDANDGTSMWGVPLPETLRYPKSTIWCKNTFCTSQTSSSKGQVMSSDTQEHGFFPSKTITEQVEIYKTWQVMLFYFQMNENRSENEHLKLNVVMCRSF